MQAAIARLAHSARFKELLAGNWNLLVTTAGAEYVPTVPAVVLPAGKPEGTVAGVAVGGQVVREPTGHLENIGARSATGDGPPSWSQWSHAGAARVTRTTPAPVVPASQA